MVLPPPEAFAILGQMRFVAVVIACVCQEKQTAVSIQRCAFGCLALYYADVFWCRSVIPWCDRDAHLVHSFFPMWMCCDAVQIVRMRKGALVPGRNIVKGHRGTQWRDLQGLCGRFESDGDRWRSQVTVGVDQVITLIEKITICILVVFALEQRNGTSSGRERFRF